MKKKNYTLEEIKDAQKHEVSRVCFELNLSVLQQDVVERMSMMLWEKAYKLGLDSKSYMQGRDNE